MHAIRSDAIPDPILPQAGNRDDSFDVGDTCGGSGGGGNGGKR
jgi:hypothetical protein